MRPIKPQKLADKFSFWGMTKMAAKFWPRYLMGKKKHP